MKYVHPSNVITGAKDTYQIILSTIDQLHKQISGKYIYMAVGAHGDINWSTTEFRIYNKRGGKIVDPAWNEKSDPPQPAGFIFDDPATWGGLMWEEIPMTDDTSEHYYDYFMSFQPETGIRSSHDFVEEALIRTLVHMGELPDDPSWSII